MIAHFFLIIALLIILPHCGLRPKYIKPSLQLPESFMYSQKQASANLVSWWHHFNDETLSELITQATKQNYTLQIALEKIIQARELYSIQTAAQFPHINATGTASKQHLSKGLDRGGVILRTTLPYFQAGFDGSWELDIWERLYNQKNASFKHYEAQIEAARDILLLVLSEVARTYILCRGYQAQASQRDKIVELDASLMKLQKDLHHAGLINAIAVAHQATALEASRAEALSAHTAYKQSVIQLALLLGVQPENFVLPSAPHIVPMSKKILTTGLPSELLRRRPDIRQSERLLDASADLVAVAYADLFPQFSLLGDIHLESNKAANFLSSQSIAWQLGPSVRWPIITFGRIKAQIRGKKSEQRQALLSYTQTIINALGDVEQKLIAYYDAQKTTALEIAQHRGLQDIEMLTRSQQHAGLASALDLKQAQKITLAQAAKIISAQQAESTALIAVYKSLGGEW